MIARATLGRALAVAIPTLLLGAGWLAASVRERASRVREEEARLEAIAASVRGAIDEGLEDLRRREDERPFYLYHHYYSPPEVLAISDPVAISPLAAGSTDPRIVGWFQVDPDGTVRTPFTVDPREPGPPSAARVRAIAAGEALADLRALVHGREAGALVARAPDIDPRPILTAALASPENEPQAPVTLEANTYALELASEIQQAQAGDYGAYRRVASRGRQAPVTVRRSVDLEQLQQAPRRTGRRSSAPAPPPQVLPVDEPSMPAPPLVPTSIEVDYTPMSWRVDADAIALTRVVSHEGAAVLQGAVLDRAAIIETWIPGVIARLAASGPSPRVVDATEDASCALRIPASATIPGLDLCFESAALASRIDALDLELRWQLGALAILVLAVAAAAFAIQRASQRAEELARQRSAFVSAVSHELRTPLTTIRMHAEMLEDDLVEEARKPRVFSELVSESVRLSRLVENVLEISRLEDGRRPLRARRADLAAHVREVVRQQAPLAQNKGFEVTLREGDPVEASFDAQAVEQIVVNLIDNAVKYGAAPIELAVTAEDGRAAIVVGDPGPGIPEREREKVFERFHRVERADNAHKPGTGIGLALVRELARAHGGDAVARERSGGGCEIHVTLPR